MSTYSRKKCILLCPNFFGYDLEIKKELETMGFDVKLHDERPFTKTLGKALLRLNIRKPIKKFVDSYFDNIFRNEKDIDLLLIINPESIPSYIIDKYRVNMSKVIVYMWDSFKNKPHSISLINCSDEFYTFDYNDYRTNDKVKFKPLFFIDKYSVSCEEEPIFDVSFIGTAHSIRYNLVSAICDGLASFTYYYCPSYLVYFYKKFLKDELLGLPLRDITFSTLTQYEILDVFKKSKAIIDIAHPDQCGLTMRTIEVLGSGKKLITNNKNVVNYDFYNHDNIFVVTDNFDGSDIKQFLSADYQKVDSDIVDNYRLSNWLKSLIS